MKLRNLRIAWSVLSAIAGLLVVGLWERSYSQPVMAPKLGGHTIAVVRGQLQVDKKLVRSSRHIVDTVNFQLDDGTQRFGVEGPTQVREAGLTVPLLIVLLLPTAGLVAPWLSIKQFSLRTLLIATTLVAVVLGLIVWLASP